MWVTRAHWMPRTSLERIFCPSYRKFYCAIPYTGATINHATINHATINHATINHATINHATINHATIVRRLVMTTGYVLADLATKVAYFSLTTVAFLFVWMLLTGIHP